MVFIGFQIKLWDFDFACIPGLIDNSKVDAEWTSKINIDPVKNRYYDIHYFFNTLTKKGFFPQFWTEPEIPQRIKDFVRRVIPEKFRKGEKVSVILSVIALLTVVSVTKHHLRSHLL